VHRRVGSGAVGEKLRPSDRQSTSREPAIEPESHTVPIDEPDPGDTPIEGGADVATRTSGSHTT
jgi:hypothetical protein